ncbi:MAG: hemagglutinin repeat-containing protein, partial [Neisseriaceae bacterium]|nr:hemagglutinin repeat-containing protein [Neisseriaceae bacterium]
MNLDGKQISNSGRLKGDVVIANADKIDIAGGKVIADSAIVIKGKEINLESTTTSNKDGTNSIDKRATIKLTGKNNNGIIYIDGEDKLNSKAANISNTSQGGNTTISGGEIELGTVTTSHNETFGEATDKNHRIVKTTEEIGTNITGIGDIQVIAKKGKLTGTAVNIDSENGKTSLYGKDGIDIKEGRKTLYLDEAYKTKSHGLLSSKTTNYQIQRNDDLAVSGFIGGANGVLISGGGDISIKGTDLISATNIIPADSTLLADSFISKSAGNNHIDNNDGVIVYSENGEVDISSAQNYYQTNEYKNTRKSGILGTGNGVMFGSIKEKNTDNHKSVETVGNQMGSTNGQVQVYAGGGVANVSGMEIIAPDGGFIKGKDGAIAQALVDTYDAVSKTEKDSSGLFIGVKGDLVNAAQTVKNSVDRASNTNNGKIAALNAAKAAYAMRDLSSQVGNIVQNKNTGNNKLTVTIGTKHQENQATNHTEIAHKTILYTKQGSEFTVTTDKNDITLHGFDMQGIENDKSAGRLILNPARDLISKSVDLHDSQNEKGKHYSIEAGIFVGQSDGASGFGVTGEVAYGENSSKLERTTHDENRINAERITFNVARNADLTGTIAKADRIDGTIKGNLKLASEQDIETYRQKSIDGNISASGNYGGGGVSGNLSYSETKADLKTVNEQTGLFAGKNGIDLTVGGNTHLDGAVIASEADKEKNRFSTETLTWHNIANEKSYESTAGSVSFSAGTGGMSFIPTLSHFEDEEHGTTNAAIFGNGTVEVRNGNLNGISRDTANANNGSLSPIDYQGYAENQEISQLIGEVGQSTVKTLDQMGVIDKDGKSGAIARGTVAALQTANNGANAGAIATNALAPVVSYEIGQYFKEENSEGSLGHIAAHAALGAATAYANDGNALAGAASAAAAEYLAPKISETLYGKTDASQLKENEKETVVGISSFVGGVAAGTLGISTNNAVIVMNTAKTAVENNYLSKAQKKQRAKEL